MNPQVAKIAQEINSTIVMHPRFRLAHDGIINIIETSNISGIPLGATVTAPSGCGKTALVKSIQRSLPSREISPEHSTVLAISAEANTNVGNIVSKLMRQIGYPTVIRTSTIHEQSSLLSSAMRQRGIRAIFIDESQHILRGKRTLSAAAITDWIKQISDDAGIVIVMLGTPDLGMIENTNDQLGSRAPAHFELREFERNDHWLGLLKQLAKTVTSFDLSPIYSNFHKPLHEASGGALRPLKQLLIASTIYAASMEKKVLDRDSLCYGHRQVFGPDSRRNNWFDDNS